LAYLFDGANDNLRTTVNGVSGIDNTAISMGAWVYSTNDPSGTNETVISLCTAFGVGGSNRTITLLPPTTSGFIFRLAEKHVTTTGNWDSDADISGSTWHHLCATRAGAGAGAATTLYVDGASVASSANPSPAGARTTGEDCVSIGENANLGNDLDGRACEFFVYNRELSADEVSVIGASKCSPTMVPNGLVWYAPAIRELTEYMQAGTASLTATNATVIEHPPVIYPSAPYLGHTTVPAAGDTPRIELFTGGGTVYELAP
jgi:hypothetical protein